MHPSESRTGHEQVTTALLEDATEISGQTQGVELAKLLPFDTILVSTVNSQYRIFLLEPETGRAVLEGSRQTTGPLEVMVLGSSLGESIPRAGWLGVGLCMEACTNDGYIRTSPVQSLCIEHQTSP